jgi:hypothetical protein
MSKQKSITTEKSFKDFHEKFINTVSCATGIPENLLTQKYDTSFSDSRIATINHQKPLQSGRRRMILIVESKIWSNFEHEQNSLIGLA